MTDTSTLQTVRKYGFYAAVVAAFAMPFALAADVMPYGVTGWNGSLGTHSVHDLVIFGVVYAGLAGLLVQFYRTEERVNAIIALPLVMVPAAIIGFAADTALAMMGVMFSVFAVVAVALHPAGRSVLAFDRVESPNRYLAALFAVVAAAMLAFAGLELLKQFTLGDDHAVIQHYGNVALAALYVVVMAGLATFRVRDWRFAAWSAGFVALYIGASSVVFPAVASSLGLVGGALVVAWAVAFVAMAERTRGRAVSETTPVDATAR